MNAEAWGLARTASLSHVEHHPAILEETISYSALPLAGAAQPVCAQGESMVHAACDLQQQCVTTPHSEPWSDTRDASALSSGPAMPTSMARGGTGRLGWVVYWRRVSFV